MLIRLWWKEARLSWPIWVFVMLMAILWQWLALRYFNADTKLGLLVPLAFFWTSLYALAISAGSFAGEKENRTLVFLDTMGVGRRLLWIAKVSFTFLTTFALAAILVAVAALGTERWDESKFGRSSLSAVCIGGLYLIQVVGWGLFWSALARTALNAAVLALICVGCFSIWEINDTPSGVFYSDLLAPTTLLVGIPTILLSGVFMIWPQRQMRRGFGYRLAVVSPESTTRDPSRRSWTNAARSLIWQTYREARLTWLIVAALGLGLPFVVIFNGGNPREFVLAFLPLAGLVAGVNVFGVENRLSTQRFLASHGVRPGVVWSVKLATWSVGILVIPLLSVLLVESFNLRGKPISVGNLRHREIISCCALVLSCFTVAQFCGMTIRRGITAGVVAIALSSLVVIPQLTLYNTSMIPAWGLLAVPFCLLAITWAWSGDWLLERPGSGRWLRLGLLSASACVVLVLGFATYRYVSVLSFDPLEETWNVPSAIAPRPGQPNATHFYEQAIANVVLKHESDWLPRVMREGWGKDETPIEQALREQGDMLAAIRKAALIPSCQFDSLNPRATSLDHPLSDQFTKLATVANLLLLDSYKHRSKGELEEAWTDIKTVIRMSRHMGGNAPLRPALSALAIERRALAVAMQWATDPKQTVELVRSKLIAFQLLPRAVSPAETMRAEWHYMDTTIGLPRDVLSEMLLNGVWKSHSYGYDSPWMKFVVDIATMPWEVARAHRVSRLLFLATIESAAYDPINRPFREIGLSASNQSLLSPPPPQEFSDGFVHAPWVVFQRNGGKPVHYIAYNDLATLQESTPLVKWLMPSLTSFLTTSDQVEVSRRALLQILALRSWQLSHGGKFPERLEMLVGSESIQLPKDPFASQPFRYVLSTGQMAYPLGWDSPWSGEKQSGEDEQVFTEGQWLLYSVGPDRRDTGATTSPNTWHVGSDIVFPLPREAWRPKPPPPEAADGGMGAAMMGGAPPGAPPPLPPSLPPD